MSDAENGRKIGGPPGAWRHATIRCVARHSNISICSFLASCGWWHGAHAKIGILDTSESPKVSCLVRQAVEEPEVLVDQHVVDVLRQQVGSEGLADPWLVSAAVPGFARDQIA